MADSQHGRLIVLCGPAGVGKGTVLGRVREQHPEIWLSVSATTRQPRPGEVDGVNYFFMTEPEFLAKEKAGEFLETARRVRPRPLRHTRETSRGTSERNTPWSWNQTYREPGRSNGARRNSASKCLPCSLSRPSLRRTETSSDRPWHRNPSTAGQKA